MATPTESILEKLESKMNELTNVDTQHSKAVNALEEEVKRVKDRHAIIVDPLTERRDKLIEEISQIFEHNRDSLLDTDSKTVVLRSGTLSSRFAATSVVVEDEPTAMAYAKRHGMLRKVTKLGKRTFVKADLKKYPEFVEKSPGMYFDRPENLIIKLAKTQIEIVRKLAPYRKRLN